MFRFLGFLRDFLLRDCDTTYFGPAILQYVNGGIGNDGKTRKKPNNLATRLTRVKNTFDQWSATRRQPGASNRALLWRFQPGNPIGTVNQATTPKPMLGPETKFGDPKPRPGDPSLGLGPTESPRIRLGSASTVWVGGNSTDQMLG